MDVEVLVDFPDDVLCAKQPITVRHIEALNREEGLTVLCSLHDVDLVARYATRLVALRDGRKVWDGPPAGFNRDTFREIYGHDAEPASNTVL